MLSQTYLTCRTHTYIFDLHTHVCTHTHFIKHHNHFKFVTICWRKQMPIYVCTHCFNYASQQEREIREGLMREEKKLGDLQGVGSD